jgi:hypothetical protein
MGTAAERVEREISVLRAELLIGDDDVTALPAPMRDYVEGLEALAGDVAERVDLRGADASSSGGGSVGSRRSDGLPPGSQRYRIAKHLCSLGLLSDEGESADEIAGNTGIPLNSVSTRMSELMRDGWVAESGENGRGKTRYAATSKAKQHFEAEAASNAAAAAASQW